MIKTATKSLQNGRKMFCTHFTKWFSISPMVSEKFRFFGDHGFTQVNGEYLYDRTNTYTWDAFGKMASVNSGTSPATYGTTGTCITYDANGRAVEVSNGSTYQQFVYSPLGKSAIMNGTTLVTGYIPMPGGAMLRVNGSQNYYGHQDWQKSARVESNISQRTVNYDRAFSPYGVAYASSGDTSHQNFTGDNQDIFPGLFDTPNRELQPLQGRWLSPEQVCNHYFGTE